MTDYLALAKHAYEFAEANYGRKNYRFDVIVECMTIEEIAEDLRSRRVRAPSGAERWARETARLHHEVELNQAWDGPESCVGSDKYRPGDHVRWDAEDRAIEAHYRSEAEAVQRDNDMLAVADAIERFAVATAHPSFLYGCTCSEDQLHLVGCDCEAGQDRYDYYDESPPPIFVGPEFADDVSLEERLEHYAFEERNGMPYGSSF